MQDTTFLIATKGRAGNVPLLEWLNGQHPDETTLFVEHQDIDSYKLYYPNVNYVILQQNNRGLAYVRNIIYKYALDNNIDYFWMPDDDITGFFYRVGNRMKKIEDPWPYFQQAQRDFIDCKHAHAGLEYQQFAWSATKPFVLNSFVDAVVWFNMPLLKQLIKSEMPYKEELLLKVDRDFCMQVIAAGGTTARSTTFALSMPKEGSNAGGLKEIAYDIEHLEESMVDKLREIWGEDKVTKIVKPSGRVDAKIHWNRLYTPPPPEPTGFFKDLFKLP